MTDRYRQELILDTRSALAALQRLEQVAKKSLSGVALDIDPRAARDLASSLDDAVVSSARIEGDLADIESDLRGSARASADFAEDMGDVVAATTRTARETLTIEERLSGAERAAARLLTQVNQAEVAAGRSKANFYEVARALDISEDEARKLSGELLTAQVRANQVEDAAQELAREMGLSGAEADRFARAMGRAETAQDGMNTRGQAGVGIFGRMRGVFLGVSATLAGLGIGFVGVARGIAATISASSDLAESTSKANVVFGREMGAINAAIADSSTTMLLSRQAALEAIATFGNLFTALGLSQRQAAELSPSIVQLAADLASFNNTSVDEALIALRSGLVGEVEPLRRLGVAINAATVEARALKLGLVDANGEVTEAGKVQARYALILEMTGNAQGDVARTLGGLANTQRSVKAQVGDLAAEIGQQLEPALQAVLAVLPSVLEGFTSLIPALAGAGTEVADFVADLKQSEGGLRTFFAQLRAGVGLSLDVSGAAKDGLQAVAAALTGDFAGAVAQVDQITTRAARGVQRAISVTVAQALDRGEDAVDTFTAAVSTMGAKTEDLEQFSDAYAEFALSTGVTKEELLAATVAMLDNAAAIGLSAPEVTFLKDRYNDLAGTVDEAGRNYIGFTGAIAAGSEALATQTTRFTSFAAAVDEVGEKVPTAFSAIAEAGSKIGDGFDPFAEAAEAIKVSGAEFLTNLREQVTATAAFEADVARLVARGFGKVAAALLAQGPAAAQAARDLVNNTTAAAEAEGLLDGVGTEAAQRVGRELEAELRSDGITGPAREAFIEVADQFESAQVTGAFARAGVSAATATGGAFGPQMFIEGEKGAGQFEAGARARIGDISLSGELAAAFASEQSLDQAFAAGAAYGDAIERGTRFALQMTSPSRVMQALARQAFADFEAAAIAAAAGGINLAIPVNAGLTGSAVASGSVGGSGGPLVALTVQGTGGDMSRDAAKAAQVAGSIMTMLGLVRGPGTIVRN